MSSFFGHALAGWSVWNGGERQEKGAAAFLWPLWLVFLALFPDVDYGVPGLQSTHHGGLRITHSLGFTLLLPACTVLGLALAGYRGAELRRKGAQALAAGLSHLLLDLLVGVTPQPLLWPLSDATVRLPFGLLPSAGHPRLTNLLFYRNLLIELGALLPLAVLAGLVRSERSASQKRRLHILALAAISVLFMGWAFTLPR